MGLELIAHGSQGELYLLNENTVIKALVNQTDRAREYEVYQKLSVNSNGDFHSIRRTTPALMSDMKLKNEMHKLKPSDVKMLQTACGLSATESIVNNILVMERINGKTLHETTLHGVTLHNSFLFVSHLIAAVRTVHHHGIAHCDLNAANIMIRHGSVVIVDFASSVDITSAASVGISYPKTTWQVVAPEILISGSNTIIKTVPTLDICNDINNDTLSPLCKDSKLSGCGVSGYVKLYDIQVDKCDMFAVGIASLSVMLGLNRSCFFSDSEAFKHLIHVARGIYGGGKNIAAKTALELWGIYYILGDIGTLDQNNMKPTDTTQTCLHMYERMMIETCGCWPPTNSHAVAALEAFRRCPLVNSYRQVVQTLPLVHQHILVSLLHPITLNRCWPLLVDKDKLY